MTKLLAVLFAAYGTLGTVQAADPTYSITTAGGKTVQVTEAALKAAYGAMIQSVHNGVFKNADGSTSIVRPAMVVSGEEHAVAGYDGFASEYAQGVCKSSGFAATLTAEFEPAIEQGPTVLLTSDGTIMQTIEQPASGIHPYLSVVCK